MVYKSKRTWKDTARPCSNPGLTRRELIKRGMATGFLSVTMYNLAMNDLIAKAAADELTCPTPERAKGGFAQIFSEGGPTMSARFLSDAQAEMVKNSAVVAKNYGVSGGANIVRIGPNLNVDKTSPFGVTLLMGPPGYVGGSSAWRANVLSKVAGGGHLGPFPIDDGLGVNAGLLAGVSTFKTSEVGKDIHLGVQNALADWAKSMPSSSVGLSKLAPSSFANVFSMTPAAAGLTHKKAMEGASTAANSIASTMSRIFGTARRKGASNLTHQAGCAFYGNKELADSTYGTRLFTPGGHSELTSKLNVSGLAASQQAMLGAYFQSASGTVGGVVTQFPGRDYHPPGEGDVAENDIEEAEAIVMFLVACEAANAPGALIYLSNGHASADGVIASASKPIFGVNSPVSAPKTKADDGGFYNAGLAIFYSPNGAPSTTRFTGKIAADGGVSSAAGVASHKEAVAGLYLSALMHIQNTGTPPSGAVNAMKAAKLSVTSDILVL